MTSDERDKCLAMEGFDDICRVEGQINLGASAIVITAEDLRQLVYDETLRFEDGEELQMAKDAVRELCRRISEHRLRSQEERHKETLFGDGKTGFGRGVCVNLGDEERFCDHHGLIQTLAELPSNKKVSIWVGQTDEERRNPK